MSSEQGIRKYILVLQWPATSEGDFDALISTEDLLQSDLLDAYGVVDGHDFGAGEMNIFIQTDRPLEAFQHAMTSLGTDPRWASVRAAYRSAGEERYVVVWPKALLIASSPKHHFRTCHWAQTTALGRTASHGGASTYSKKSNGASIGSSSSSHPP